MNEQEVLARIEKWAGGPQQAVVWYREAKIPALGGVTVESLMRAGRVDAVAAYLDAIETGSFA